MQEFLVPLTDKCAMHRRSVESADVRDVASCPRPKEVALLCNGTIENGKSHTWQSFPKPENQKDFNSHY